VRSVTIPNSVRTIGDLAFHSCAITSVVIPNSVVTIGEAAFEFNAALASVTIGNSVTTIGNSAFSGCRALRTVVIPNSVVTIGESAFRDCRALTSVTIGSAVRTIGSGAFFRCNAITEIINLAATPQALTNEFEEVNMNVAVLRVPAGSLEAYRAANVWKNFKNIVAIEGSEVTNAANDNAANDNTAVTVVNEAREPKTITREFTTSGNHTLVFNEEFPATIEIYMFGAGGGGQGGHSKDYQQGVSRRTERGSGGGGGGGSAIYAKFEATSAVTLNITVGQGGAGGAGLAKPVGGSWESGTPGSVGGNTIVRWGSSTLTARGGAGGGKPGAQNVEGGAGGWPEHVPTGLLENVRVDGRPGANGRHNSTSEGTGGLTGEIVAGTGSYPHNGLRGWPGVSDNAPRNGGGGKGGHGNTTGGAGAHGWVIIYITY